MLIAFDDMIADMLNNKKYNPMVPEIFIRGRKLNISLVFVTQPYFVVSVDIRLDSTDYFIMKFQTKQNFIKLCLIIHQMLTLKTL